MNEFLCVLLLLWPGALAAPKADPAEWVPSDALLFVGVDDLRVMFDNARKTSGMKLLEDESAGAFAAYGTFVRKLRERIASLVDSSPDQLDNPFAGPAAFYLTVAPGRKLEDASAALVLTIGDRERLARYYATGIKKLREAAASYEAVPVGSWSIDAFTGRPRETEPPGDRESGADDASDQDDEADPFGMAEQDAELALEAALDKFFSVDSMPDRLATCLADDRLIVATDADEIKAILRREDRGRTLADSDEHRLLARQLDKPGTLRWLINVPRFIELAPPSDEQGARLATALGVKCMGCVIGHARVADDGPVESRAEAVWLRRGEPTGLVKLLSMKNGPLAPPAFVSNASPMFMSLHVDPASILDEIERINRAIDPALADQMRADLEEFSTPDGEKLNLRKTLFENLRPPLTLQLSLTRPAGARSARLLASVGHRDQAAIERLLGMVPMFVARDAPGAQVYDAAMFGISLAATADTVFAGTTAAVEAALQARESDALAGDATFRRTAQAAPQEGWAALYVDTRRMLDALLDLLPHADEIRSNPMGNPSGMFALGMAESMLGGEKVKPDDLRRVLKYYAPACFTLDTTPAGIRLSWVSLKPQAD